ncbi:MAG: hypothetical protein ACTSRI_16865 [Promethearchaeota archaeon]
MTSIVIAIPEAPPLQEQEPQITQNDYYTRDNPINATYILFWFVALLIIGSLLSFVFLVKKEKAVLAITSLASVVGIIVLASMIYLIVSQLLSIGYVADPDSLINLWLLIPVIFVTYLSYKLWNDKLFYKKYKLTFGFLTWGIILTIILSIVLFLIAIPFSDGDGFVVLVPISILFLGAIITFVLSVLGLIIDKKRK